MSTDTLSFLAEVVTILAPLFAFIYWVTTKIMKVITKSIDSAVKEHLAPPLTKVGAEIAELNLQVDRMERALSLTNSLVDLLESKVGNISEEQKRVKDELRDRREKDK